MRTALILYGTLSLLDAVIVFLALLMHPTREPSLFSSLPLSYLGGQFALHVVVGFLVGASSLDLQRALVGAGFGPLIDIDHVGTLLGLPVNPRAGHSFIEIMALILLIWSLSAWKWGRRDFAVFTSLEFFAHFMVAPPGFPLLSPISMRVYSFSNLVWIPFTVGVAFTYFFMAKRVRLRALGNL